MLYAVSLAPDWQRRKVEAHDNLTIVKVSATSARRWNGKQSNCVSYKISECWYYLIINYEIILFLINIALMWYSISCLSKLKFVINKF